MSMEQEFFTLNNGHHIPAIAIIGTGTKWFKRDGDESKISNELVESIEYALTLPGIVHLDAAEVYRTYPEVARALSSTKKDRKDIFLTDKCSTYPKLSDSPKAALQKSLEKMGVDYVDLYLLHAPFISKETHGYSLEEAWQEMEELYNSGKARNIGISNFAVDDIERVLAVAKVKPQVNQIEYNAFLQNQTPGIYNYCLEKDILLAAYSPLAPLQKKPSNANGIPFYSYVNKLATKYGVTDSQILLRWVFQRHVLPVTTSSKAERINDAQNIFKFKLEDSEVEQIKNLGLEHEPLRLYWTEQYNKFNCESQSSK